MLFDLSDCFVCDFGARTFCLCVNLKTMTIGDDLSDSSYCVEPRKGMPKQKEIRNRRN